MSSRRARALRNFQSIRCPLVEDLLADGLESRRQVFRSIELVVHVGRFGLKRVLEMLT
jgi:hypothetical protein